MQICDHLRIPGSILPIFGATQAPVEVEKAEGIITAELKRARWTEPDLTRQRKGHPVKVRLAQQLRAQTTLTVRQIAERLEMGTQASLQTEGLRRTRIFLRVSGRFSQVLGFAREVERGTATVTVDNLSIQDRPESPGSLEARFDLSVYGPPVGF